MKHKLTFIRINNQSVLSKAIQEVEKYGYSRIGNDVPTFEKAKSSYHGNCKLIMKLFYNSILNRNEWQLSTMTIEKSYLAISEKLLCEDVTNKYLQGGY